MRTLGWMALPLLLAAPLATQALTLTQSTDPAGITTGNSASCNSGAAYPDNSYYRVFDLSALGISGDVTVTSVRMAVEESAGGPHPLSVRLYRLAGDFVLANLISLGEAETVEIPDESSTFHDVAVEPAQSLPATDRLVVELYTPASGGTFFVGSNAAGQSAPGYIRASECGVPEPISFEAIGFPNTHLLLAVAVGDAVCGNSSVESGEYCDDGNLDDGDGCDSNCTATACGNGVVTLGEGCDDGNLADFDGCSSTCAVTSCGNGVLDPGEACDDGNLVNWDGCTSICTVASYAGAAGGSSGCSSGTGGSLALLGLLLALPLRFPSRRRR